MKPEFSFQTPVQFLKSVGPARTRALTRLGIENVGHLLEHYPRRYFDRTSTVPVQRIRAGEEVTVQGEVLTVGDRRSQRGGSVQTVTVGDDSGVLFCLWFNQKYLLKQFRSGQKIMVSGTAQRHNGRMQLTHPDFEILSGKKNEGDVPLHTGRMVPVYPLTAGIGQHWLRSLVFQALTRLEPKAGRPGPESLPDKLLLSRQLIPLSKALNDIHFPRDRASLQQAQMRLKYDEGFLTQLLMARRRGETEEAIGVKLNQPGDLTRSLVDNLPFELTGAQRRVLAEILADLKQGKVMHRLVQGDVGCGKTLVAFIACLFVIEQGYQAVLMAPTEVLARQHGSGLRKYSEALGVTVETLTGSTPAAERRQILAATAAGEVDLLVGTHAVIQKDVRVPRLALSVVDEQHRFGVRQRGMTAQGSEVVEQSHVLVMSATPIPRSLALTLYGDLDLSLIDQLPGGRQPIVTQLAQGRDEDQIWEDCRRELDAGRQVFVVHPVIEETEGQDLKAATVEYERLAREVFPEMHVALLHGKLKSREKHEIMARFAAGEVQILVATTVIEVGVDVPNATRMVIHNPERFGLAQLHQLRGRIGRGAHASTCILLCDRYLAGETYERIRFFADNLDGFALAEQDLRTRGPGEAWGTRQHGEPGFRLLNPVADAELIRICHQDCRRFLEQDPQLKSSAGRHLQDSLETLFPSVQRTLSG